MQQKGQQWTVPVGGGITRVVVFKGQAMSLGFQYFKNVKRPDDGPGTQVRFNLAFIYPAKS